MESKTDTIQSIVSEEYVAVEESEFAGVAVDQMRSFSPRDDETTVYYVYVTDEDGRLIGVVSTRQLLNADEDQLIGELMDGDVISVTVDEDPEVTADLVRETDFPALPVVDNTDRLVGVVRADDMVEVMEEEASEDMFKHAGFSGIEERRSLEILESSISRIVSLRMPWLLVALAGGLAAGAVIEQYEATLEQVAAIAFFIPVIMDMGGNVGTQSSTIFVRGLAAGHIDDRNAMRHFAREGMVGLAVGGIVGAIGAAAAYAWQGLWRGQDFAAELAAVVFIALAAVCLVASVIGYVIPWITHKVGYDPAAASDPLITTVKDITALLIYFTLVVVLMGEFL